MMVSWCCAVVGEDCSTYALESSLGGSVGLREALGGYITRSISNRPCSELAKSAAA